MDTLLQSEAREFWFEVSESIFQDCANRVNNLAPKDFGFCYDAVLNNAVGIDRFIDWHGMESLFKLRRYRLFPHALNIPLAYRLLNSVVGENGESQLLSANLSQMLLSLPTPWAKGPDLRSRPQLLESFIGRQRSEARHPRDLERDELFAAVVLTALTLEIEGLDVGWIRSSDLPFFEKLRWLFVGRVHPSKRASAKRDLDELPFTPEQRKFVWDWVTGRINLAAVKKGAGRNRLHKTT